MKITDIKEQGDNCNLTVSYTTKEKNLILKYYKRKRLTRKLMKRFVIEGTLNYAKSLGEGIDELKKLLKKEGCYI